MRKLYYYIILPLMALVSSCQQEEIIPVEQDGDVMKVYAIIEDIDGCQTRTYLSGSEVYWSSGDQIAVFMENTLRKRFNVIPESVGSKDATFQYDSQYGAGKSENISHNVAYYPFCEVACVPDGTSYTLNNLILPSNQSYVDGTVGIGAFPMVAVTEDVNDINFCFKNLCGVMQFQLKGYGFVKSVSVKGNRGEILAGPAVVTAGYGKDPSISLSAEGAMEVTLDCGESGVELNETTPVSFFIALPPVQFEEGFTITVTDTWGGSKEYSTTKKNPIVRSKGLRMPAKEYIGIRSPQEGDYVDEYGVNHGQGVEIDGVVWAPVNCGYKAPTAYSNGFSYGKLYQWGRKYGQGYEGAFYINGTQSGLYSDESSPVIEKGGISPISGNDIGYSNVFFTGTYGYTEHWSYPADGTLWTEKTRGKYDPCPDGWRVPNVDELGGLIKNHSSWTIYQNQEGYWFSGNSAYSNDVPQVFLPAAGSLAYTSGSAYGRGNAGYYWSSSTYSGSSFLLIFSNGSSRTDGYGGARASGHAVRCVQL